MNTTLKDLSFALRLLRRDPVSSLVMVLTLALGIGGNMSMYAGFDAWVLRPLAFREPSELVDLRETRPKLGEEEHGISEANYLDWQRQVGSFAGMGAYVRRAFNLDDEEDPERVVGSSVSASLFPLLGIEPVLGRNFVAEEDQPAGAKAVLLSDDLWRRRFGSDPQVLGKTLRLDGQVHSVVGVMPPGFEFPEWAEVWTPLGLGEGKESRGERYLNAVARLAPGVSIDEAGLDIAAVAERLEQQFPESNAGWSARVRPLREQWAPPVIRLALGAGLVAAAFVLLIICANVTNLMLAQSARRRHETALRSALGASRSRLVRQWLTESLVLSLVGGALGFLLGTWWIEWGKTWAPIEIPYLFRFETGPKVIFFTLFASLGAGLLCGLAPVFRSSSFEPSDALKSGGRPVGTSPGGVRLRRLLVVGEFTLAVMLVIGALLMVKSFLREQQIESGYRVDQVLTLRLSMTGEAYEDPADRLTLVEDALELLPRISAVEAVGVTNHLPESTSGWQEARLDVEGRAFAPGEEPRTESYFVAGDYLKTLDVPVEEGRGFTASDSLEGSPVVLVSRSLASALWPTGSAVDRRLRLFGDETAPWLRVIGVVGDVQRGHQMVAASSRPGTQMYLPYRRQPAPQVTLALHTSSDPAAVSSSVRRQLAVLDPGLSVEDVMSLRDAVFQVRWVSSYFTKLFSLYAALALVIAALGAYGVTADSVSQRRREMGIRRALGASRKNLLAQVVGQGVGMAILGVGVGVLAALPMTRFLSSMLYEVSARDPVVFAGVAILMAAIAGVASYLPARRATRVDPMEILRSD